MLWWGSCCPPSNPVCVRLHGVARHRDNQPARCTINRRFRCATSRREHRVTRYIPVGSTEPKEKEGGFGGLVSRYCPDSHRVVQRARYVVAAESVRNCYRNAKSRTPTSGGACNFRCYNCNLFRRMLSGEPNCDRCSALGAPPPEGACHRRCDICHRFFRRVVPEQPSLVADAPLDD
jgi:hypothetical protein